MVCDRVRIEDVGSKREVKEVDFVDFWYVSLSFWRVFNCDVEVHIADHALQNDGPKRSIHQLLIFYDSGELVK